MKQNAAKETAKALIENKVKLFHSNKSKLKTTQYSEADTISEFIAPLFKALGWDFDNNNGTDFEKREVRQQVNVFIEGHMKKPDIGFYKDDKVLFFVEAKRPIEKIDTNTGFSFQLRNYGWHKERVPISVLTDFEEFAVYDCNVKPFRSDDPKMARLDYFTYEQYLNNKRFDFLWQYFSKDNVYQGSLDELASNTTFKKGHLPINKDFLISLEKWRMILANEIYINNPKLSVSEIGYCVQLLLDRIIFLRICEGKGIEAQQTLFKLSSKDTYKHLLEYFKKADQKYNSGLFDFEREDKITPKIKLSDSGLSSFLAGLYVPNCPYYFSEIPIEVLGNAYEQFLGKEIIVAQHKIDIVPKPDVRKAGGVFYTPQYIVDYIIENTIGEKLNTIIQNKRKGVKAILDEVSDLKIIDPACGSGSFLIGAYDFLLRWHVDFYRKISKNKIDADALKLNDRFLTKTGKLTLREKKRILNNNIFGTDIDKNAVEITKLSLMLKSLDNEDNDTVANEMSLFNEKLLPHLSGNIKVGNSLIQSDVKKTYHLTKEELEKVNPFDWQLEYAEIFKKGGFDIIIGNPPYVYTPDKLMQNYFSQKYQHQDYQQDLYLLFLERYELILKKGGTFGVIISNSWLQSILLRKIRKHLIETYTWKKFLHLPEKVFQDAVVDTHVLIFEKSKPKISDSVAIEVYAKQTLGKSHNIMQSELPQNGDIINLVARPNERKLFEKIKQNTVNLKEFCDVYVGVKPFQVGKGKPKQTAEIVKEKPFVKENCLRPSNEWLPLLRGSLMHRYKNLWKNDWILYGEWLAEPRKLELFTAPEKIMVRQTGDSIIGTIVGDGVVARNNLHIIIAKNETINYKLILGILNSKLIDFCYTQINPEKGEALAEVKKNHVEVLPLPKPSKDKGVKALENTIIKNVELLLQLNIDIQKENDAVKISKIKQSINAAEKIINNNVYKLYGLTEQEIEIIEQ